MGYRIRKAIPEDEQRIRELFIEMLQTIYHKEDVEGYESGYLDRYWTNGEDVLFVAEDNEVVAYLAVEVHREDEMESSGIADAIRAEEGNLRYEYFQPLNDPETVLLIDSWSDQEAIDAHHASPMMKQLAELRNKYDLHMTVERFVSDEYESDEKYLRK